MERPFSCQHFVQDYAEAKYIRAVIDYVSPHLFGRHITGSTHYDAGVGHGFPCFVLGPVNGGVPLAELGKAASEGLNAVVFSHETDLRLQVTVNKSLYLRRL